MYNIVFFINLVIKHSHRALVIGMQPHLVVLYQVSSKNGSVAINDSILKVMPRALNLVYSIIYTQKKKKRTTTIFPLRSPLNTKMLIVMKYSFLIKSY